MTTKLYVVGGEISSPESSYIQLKEVWGPFETPEKAEEVLKEKKHLNKDKTSYETMIIRAIIPEESVKE